MQHWHRTAQKKLDFMLQPYRRLGILNHNQIQTIIRSHRRRQRQGITTTTQTTP
jgi:hypothetical protein